MFKIALKQICCPVVCGRVTTDRFETSPKLAPRRPFLLSQSRVTSHGETGTHERASDQFLVTLGRAMAAAQDMDMGVRAEAEAEAEVGARPAAESGANGKGAEGGDGKGGDGAGPAALRDVYMMATREDYLLLALGSVAALANGLGDPILIVLFSSSLSALSNPADALSEMGRIALIFVGVGACLLVAASVQFVCFTKVANRLSVRMQRAWYAALLRQDVAWFDANNPSGLSAKISSSILTFEEGLGGKLGMAVQFAAGFVGALVIGFYYNAYVALITLAGMPLCAAALAWLLRLNGDDAEKKGQAYARANALAYETFKGLKTVLSLNAAAKMEQK